MDSYTFTIYLNISPKDIFPIDYNIYNNYISEFESKTENYENKLLKNINNDDNHGYFFMKLTDENFCRFIPAKENNAVLFSSVFLHYGECFKSNSSNLRCVVAFKLYVE